MLDRMSWLDVKMPKQARSLNMFTKKEKWRTMKIQIMACLVLLSLPGICNAAKPVKLQPGAGESASEGSEIRNFKVSCSDGLSHVIYNAPQKKRSGALKINPINVGKSRLRRLR